MLDQLNKKAKFIVAPYTAAISVIPETVSPKNSVPNTRLQNVHSSVEQTTCAETLFRHQPLHVIVFVARGCLQLENEFLVKAVAGFQETMRVFRQHFDLATRVRRDRGSKTWDAKERRNARKDVARAIKDGFMSMAHRWDNETKYREGQESIGRDRSHAEMLDEMAEEPK